MGSRTAIEERRFRGDRAITLRAGDLAATFVPDVGMTGVSLRYRGREHLALPGGLDALRAGQNIGISIPKERAGRAADFVMHCYNKLQRGFSYTPRSDATAAMTGVAVLNLYLLEAQNREETIAGVQYLIDHPVTAETRFPYYAIYYTTQAAFQAGDPAWSAVWKTTQAQLLPMQSPDAI